MKHKKLILGLILAFITIVLIVVNAFYVLPHKLTIREETLVSNKFDDSLDGTTIAFFTDLHYGTYITDEDVDKCVNTINSVKPDIVLFAGDLIDHYSTNGISEENRNILIDKLKTIDAKIGKYAVLGNHDTSTKKAREDISSILEEAGFILLTNKNIQLSNGSDKCINLIGIDTIANGTPDVASAYNGISDGSYTIVFTHCPDIVDEINTNITDYVLAGHSHGGQVYIPIFNRFYRPIGCKKYFTGKHRFGNTTLDITNGVGLTNKSIRLFADAEVVFYKFKAK